MEKESHGVDGLAQANERRRKMKYLSLEEQKQLLKTVKETKGAERDHVIVEILLHTGLRVSELVAVNVGDVRNKSRLYVQPEAMKNGRGRFVPLNVWIQDTLRKWIAHKMSVLHEGIEDTAPLFVTKGGRRLTRQDLTQSVIEKWMLRAGLTTTRAGAIAALYSSHSLRHTCFKRMRERGVSLEVIQKIAGHKSLASTGIYTEASDQEVNEAVHVLSLSPTRAMRLQEAL
jgi:site-specific recombinase XerD